ncbi:hypothetical protein WOLCODRAFT_162218 [Wolfiporia cocos MD-104 SS10]|uniref:Uncharacterized protein n=1 Tax=Wolfiporia cocos (strain MD-104) TaxID=742152 RepID=A0A2H3JDD7_WOLCO|nr:hypothetical protein WOLCODRAFT_162218 [Wolfiporia cocos MD-104 SS10]
MVKPSSFLPKGARQPASGDKPSKLPTSRIPRRAGLSRPVKGCATAHPRPRGTRGSFENILCQNWDVKKVKGDLNKEYIMVMQVEGQCDSSDIAMTNGNNVDKTDKADDLQRVTFKPIAASRQRSNSESTTESTEPGARTPCSYDGYAIGADSATIEWVDSLVGGAAATIADEAVDARKEQGPVCQLAQRVQTPEANVIRSGKTDAHTRLLDGVLAELARPHDVDTAAVKAKAHRHLLDDVVADVKASLNKAYADLLDAVVTEIEVAQYATAALDVINASVDEETFGAAAPLQTIGTGKGAGVQYWKDVFSESVVASETTDVHWYPAITDDENLSKYAVSDEYSSDAMANRWVLDTRGDQYMNQNQRPLVRRIDHDDDPWAARWILDTRGDELLPGRNRTDKYVSKDYWASRWTLDTTGDDYLGRRPIVRAAESEDDRWATRWVLHRTEDDEVILKDVTKLRSMAIRNCVRLGVPICFYAF